LGTNILKNRYFNFFGRSIAPPDLMLYLFIVSGECVRAIVPFIHNPLHAIWSDPGRWWEYASTGTDTPPLALIDPVFYQAWLSFVAKLTLDIPVLTALYAAVLSVITPWIWYKFFRELLPVKRYALAGWAILAWLPSWIGIYSYYMSETLLLPLMGLSLWLSWRSMRKRDVGSFGLAAFCWTLAGTTRAVAAPVAAAVTVFTWWRQERRVASAIGAGLIIVLILGSLSYRSYQRTGLLAPLGQGAMNQIYAQSGKKEIKINYSSSNGVRFYYGFGSPSVGIAPFEPFSDWRTSRTGVVDVNIDLDNQSASWRQAQSLAGESAPSALPLIAENITFLFFGHSWPDTNRKHFFEQLSNWMRFVWAPLFIICVVMLIRIIRKGERKHAPPLLMALLLWFLIQGVLLISVNEGRYRKPAEGLIIAAMLFAASRRSDKFKNISGID